MAIKQLTLTDEHIKLIKSINFSGIYHETSFNTDKIEEFIVKLRQLPSDKISEYGDVMFDASEIVDKLDRINADIFRFGWGIDQYNIYGGSNILESISIILGKYDEYKKWLSNEGVVLDLFNDEIKRHMMDLHTYICSNMVYIFNLILFMCDKGGISPGTYTMNSDGEWFKVD